MEKEPSVIVYIELSPRIMDDDYYEKIKKVEKKLSELQEDDLEIHLNFRWSLFSDGYPES